MRYSAEHSQKTRESILEAAGRQFRKNGFGGVGIDALAKAAGVTSGAFYRHFRSKNEVFRAIAVAGLERLRIGVADFRGRLGDGWFDAFATFYTGPNRRDLPGGCVLPSLSAEVARADAKTRSAYEAELVKVASLVADGLPGRPSRDVAWPILAMLAGGVMLARAVQDKAVAEEIAAAVLSAMRSR